MNTGVLAGNEPLSLSEGAITFHILYGMNYKIFRR